MKSGFLSRRHRNPPQQTEQEKEQPFFPKSNDAEQQPFFTAGSNAEVNSPAIQAKLSIGQPGDKYEQEADAVANQVVSGQNNTPVLQRQEISTLQRSTLATPQEDEKLSTAESRMEKDKLIQEKPEVQLEKKPEEEPIQKMTEPKEEEEPVQKKEEPKEEEPLQKKEEPKEEEEPLQKKDAPKEEKEPLQMAKEEEEPLQKKAETASNSTASTQLSSRIKEASGKGTHLPDQTRTEMEGAIGADFSGVNIHTDTDAVQMNRELGAQAFTHGQDVYFNSGKYNPEDSSGKHLLAHELTHVVQQGKSPKVQRCPQGKAPLNPRTGKRRVTREYLGATRPVNRLNYITHLQVSISGRTVVATWSQGGTNTWECTPNPVGSGSGTPTPIGNDVVGAKCGENHTNRHGDYMSYFTSFRRHNYVIGFHNSQRVGSRYHSHGCVRVRCAVAEIINRNTWSGRTRISVTR
jgi:hypothetical protein